MGSIVGAACCGLTPVACCALMCCVLCSTDVLLAMAELGSNGLTHDGLSSFVRKHIHGLSSSESASDAGDWVVV